MSWLTGWSYRKKITIDSAKIDAGLSDFPVKVILDEYNFDFGKALENGYDLRFTSADGETLLKYEREVHDLGDTIGVYHVKVPSVSSESDTEIFVYFGKADASDGADAENVWDSNYKVVHHMTPDLYDSTANNHDGSNQGSESAINRAGHYRTFNDAYVSLGSSVNFSLTDKITIEGHCKSTSDTNMRLFNRHETPSGNYGYMLSRSLTNDNAEWRISKTKADWNGGMTSNDSWPINTDLHVVGTYDGSNMRAYFNGATTSGDFPASLSGNIASVAHNAYIGAGNAATNKWYGNIYEFRLSNIARSDAWIKATYNSLADTLLTYGALEKETYSVSTAKVFVIE